MPPASQLHVNCISMRAQMFCLLLLEDLGSVYRLFNHNAQQERHLCPWIDVKPLGVYPGMVYDCEF